MKINLAQTSFAKNTKSILVLGNNESTATISILKRKSTNLNDYKYETHNELYGGDQQFIPNNFFLE